jgi:hypothetical protein
MSKGQDEILLVYSGAVGIAFPYDPHEGVVT